MAKREKDALSGVETTGHNWDGVQELDNPMPKWWLYTFYACIAWAVGYYFFYPAWPLGTTYTKGLAGYSQREEVVKDIAAGKAAQEKFLTAISAKSVDEIQQDRELQGFAMVGGRSVFNENCAACHGAGGQGVKGYPNLADDVWIWGGTTADIHQTIRYGIRSAHEETRGIVGTGMTAFGRDGILTHPQINQVAEYVLSLNNRGTDAAAAEAGKEIFAENCVACHGEKAEGSVVAGIEGVGAPPLVSGNFLYGNDKASVVSVIQNGRAGVMPAWVGRFDEATIKMLAVYVHNLGGGK